MNTNSNPMKYENLKYHRANLNNISKAHPGSIKFQIAELISKKVDFLNMVTTEINPLNMRLKTVVNTPGKSDPNRQFCKVTGLNISMQKEDSFLPSHTGLNYYYKTDRKIFKEVKRKYPSALWNNSDHTTQIREIAHNIRNRYNNQRLKQQRIYTPRQPLLFDLATL